MISPEELKERAEKIFGQFLRAWVAGEPFFPKEVRCDKRPPADIAMAARAVEALRAAAKESTGYGYSVEWQEVNSRTFGRNKLPQRIYFAEPPDLLRFVGKTRQFERFTAAVDKIHAAFPELDGWLASHTRQLIAVTSEVDGLLSVVRCLRDNPRPNCFVRELPAPVHSKFIEQHQTLLRQWLDIVLPHEAVLAYEQRFERRYGLKYKDDYIILRVLDRSLQKELQIPFDDLKAPLEALASLAPPRMNVYIVENEIPLRSLPPLQRGIGLGGLGDGVTILGRLPWLDDLPIVYWGDLDVEGLEALSALRARLPQVQSILMDRQTVTAFRELATAGKGGNGRTPAHLTPREVEAFELLRAENLRIEQEKLPPAAIQKALAAKAGCGW